MIDFTDSARTQLAALQATPSRDRAIGAVDALRAAIRRRDAPVLVASLAQEAGDLLAAAPRGMDQCALLAGALTWAAATHAVAISGASRQVVEGCVSLMGAAILVGVGLWMHQKSTAGQWQLYLEDKLAVALDRRSAWGLFALAFVAVYREVFETALFYSALAVDGSSGALASGFIAAVSLLAVIAWVLLRTSARSPLAEFSSSMING
ncbi:hypothetical protein FVD38_17950 [Massilia arenae]|uniref:Iron permease n=2 Tax=Massilia arenae TaxID=2603288 RepID=A0A5C7G1U5_9BURK|nr:hypothetical protein FVD38_17950 [Massilia arenae]